MQQTLTQDRSGGICNSSADLMKTTSVYADHPEVIGVQTREREPRRHYRRAFEASLSVMLELMALGGGGPEDPRVHGGGCASLEPGKDGI